jgi:cytochrome P450
MSESNAPFCDIDLEDPDFAKNPYQTYKLLREKYPVCQIADGTYLLSRYDDVQLALKRYDLFASGWMTSSIGRPNWLREDCKRGAFLAEMDPPDHALHNAIINKTFSSGAVNSLIPLMRETAKSLVKRLKEFEGKEVDFFIHFGYPFSGALIDRITGLNTSDDIDRTKRWSRLMESLPAQCPEPALKAEFEATILSQNKHYDEIIQSRRIYPKGDLVSILINAQIDDSPLSTEELRAALSLFSVAGFEAPAQSLARAIILLAQRDDICNLLRERPENIRPFIEELLRLGSSAQGSLRITTQDVTLHSVTIPAQSVVLALIGAANRDSDRFSNPDDFVLSRPNIKSHIGFGQGPHVCIGASLARAELRIGLEALLSTFKKFHCPAETELNWRSWVVARLLRTLPVRFISA